MYNESCIRSTSYVFLEDSTISSFVTGPASVPAINNIAVFSSTGGKAITSATSGIGTIGALTLANTIASSSPTTGTLILSGSSAGLGVNGKGYFNSNVVIGAAQTMIQDHALTLRGANGFLSGGHIIAYVSTSQYPVYQQINWQTDNIAHSYDSYWDNVAWRSSYSGSNYQIYKIITI